MKRKRNKGRVVDHLILHEGTFWYCFKGVEDGARTDRDLSVEYPQTSRVVCNQQFWISTQSSPEQLYGVTKFRPFKYR